VLGKPRRPEGQKNVGLLTLRISSLRRINSVAVGGIADMRPQWMARPCDAVAPSQTLDAVFCRDARR